MRNIIKTGDPRDAAWLNLVVVGYAASAATLVAVDMLQPVLWYLRGGPIVGVLEVHPLVTSVADTLGPIGWLLIITPLMMAVVVLATRSAFCRPALVALGVLVAVLPLLRLSPTDVFAPFASLRIDHDGTDGGTVWMLSEGGTSLVERRGPDGESLFLGNVSKDMIAPVAAAVSAAPNAHWRCGADGAETFTLKTGRNTAVLEGCALEDVPDGRIDGLPEMDAFSILTLLTLMTQGT